MKLYWAGYRREFSSPFSYGERTISFREGICLRLETEGGALYSEASPLMGHSLESLDEVKSYLSGTPEEDLVLQIFQEKPLDGPASLRFALEGFQAQIVNAGKKKRPVPASALVPWRGGEVTLREILAKGADGYSTVKLKVTDANSRELLETLQGLKGKEMLVRLDGNRSLSEKTLTDFFRGLREVSLWVEYFEEPFAHWALPALGDCPVPLAADECAANPALWRALLKAKHGPEVFVLKPTVSGGLFSLADRASQLTEAGKRIIYSSALEAEPGRRALLEFLSAIGSDVPSGLSTGFLFRESFLPDRPEHIPPFTPTPEEKAWLDSLAWQSLS